MTKDKVEKRVMVVEITGGVLRHIRSSGTYANLAGYEAEYIAFMSYQGTFLGEVKSIQKRVPLNKIYTDVMSTSRTNLYRVKNLVKHPLRRNSKIPRGKKRVVEYEKFINAKVTSDLFKSSR